MIVITIGFVKIGHPLWYHRSLLMGCFCFVRISLYILCHSMILYSRKQFKRYHKYCSQELELHTNQIIHPKTTQSMEITWFYANCHGCVQIYVRSCVSTELGWVLSSITTWENEWVLSCALHTREQQLVLRMR